MTRHTQLLKRKEIEEHISTAEQRKYLSYTALALLGYILARHLVKSAVKSLKDDED